MDIEKYVPESQDIPQVAGAREVGASRALLRAAEIKRDALRAEVEDKPQAGHSDVRKNAVFKLGEIKSLNWLLSLPGAAQEVLEQLKEDGF